MIKRYFRFDELQTDFRHEITGGLTTFITMAYIIIVNPKILEAAGIPFGPSMVATIVSAFFGTMLMALYARRPFAVAPYMGQNAFVAFTVVKVMGFSWQTALGAIFIGGVLFTALTLFKIRSWLANLIPMNLKISFAVGIGLFLTFIGLNESGIVTIGVPGAPVNIGSLSHPGPLCAIITVLAIAFLMIRRVKGSMLIGIVGMTAIAIALQAVWPDLQSGGHPLVRIPDAVVSLPPSLGPIFLKLDILGALSWGFFSVVLTVFVMDFVDTMGTLIGLSYRAKLLDEKGELPEIEKPMLCDALAMTAAALLGTTTTGAYIESAAGIEEGAKSGFASVVTAVMMLSALFFAPLFSVIPPFAYGPALIIVGMMMISPVTNINFDDMSDLIPSFITITLMCFTYNLGIGMTAGFVSYPLIKIFAGKVKEVSAGMWVLFVFSLAFFIFYPY
ncbi:MAG: guanine permease [Spirochaetes bacterium RBG_13_51_14]|nr:MAG: guanine permease [Spirochaetes bacterium RBG_13_51_14]